jgi:hypothetical protein
MDDSAVFIDRRGIKYARTGGVGLKADPTLFNEVDSATHLEIEELAFFGGFGSFGCFGFFGSLRGLLRFPISELPSLD